MIGACSKGYKTVLSHALQQHTAHHLNHEPGHDDLTKASRCGVGLSRNEQQDGQHHRPHQWAKAAFICRSATPMIKRQCLQDICLGCCETQPASLLQSEQVEVVRLRGAHSRVRTSKHSSPRTRLRGMEAAAFDRVHCPPELLLRNWRACAIARHHDAFLGHLLRWCKVLRHSFANEPGSAVDI